MDFVLQFAYSAVIYVLIPVILLVVWYRIKRYQGVLYRYPLTTTVKNHGYISSHPYKKILFTIRVSILLGLALLIAKPQFVDPHSKILVEGIDIILVMDVSGSMNMPHHVDDARTRIEVAKIEAMRFIDKRIHDAFGIVVFGNDALSRCPLTADKAMLKTIVRDINIGMINPEGTLLSTAVVTAANRLKNSKSKSKIMILLTDGEPSENDSDPQVAIEIARKLGIKIYTVGIGDDQEIPVYHPIYGVIPIKTTLNKKLLTKMAEKTGGKFFEAKKASDMRQIYDAIDELEKSEIETPQFSHFYDFFIPIVWFLLFLVFTEIILKATIWFSL